MRRLLVLSAALAAALAPGRASANPIDQFGFGSRSSAMAGAAAADRDNGSAANYYNPGSVGMNERMSIDAGYMWNQPNLRINDLDQNVDTSHGFVGGLVVPGKIGKVDMALGISVHLPYARITRTRQLPFSRPRWVLFDNRPQRFLLAANLAFRVHPMISIGGGVSFLSRTEGLLNLRGLVGLPDPDDSDLDLAIDVDLKAVRYPQFGVLFVPRKDLSFGLTYRHQFELSVKQGFRVEGNVGVPGGRPIIEDAFFQLVSSSRDLFQPMQIALGTEYRPTARTRLALDAIYHRWSTFSDPAALIDLSLDLKDLQSLVNLPPPRSNGPARFEDKVVVRVGGEYRVYDCPCLGIDARAGYAYDPSPVPEQRGTDSNFVDADKHTFALGAGFSLKAVKPILPRPLQIDVHFSATVLPERETRKDSPVDPVGDYTAGGTLWSAGLMTRMEF